MNENDKHWNNIKFNASKWREFEQKESEIRLKIISLQSELEEFQRLKKNYMKKTRALILMEVI